MRNGLCSLIVLFASIASSQAQGIPAALRGKWVVERGLPTSTISCWGEAEARRIVGTEIEYLADSFRWQNIVVHHPKVNVELLSAERFRDENSGQGANSSQVSFRQLGIRRSKTTQVTITHSPASLTGATTEIPGDVVLLKNRNTIVFSVCNVFFEAKRASASTR